MADPFIGNYRFGGAERIAYNRLGSHDERWAYLVFARERHHAEDQRIANNPRRRHKYRKTPFLVMREWRALAPGTRHNRIVRARTDQARPDVVNVNVVYGSDSETPGSISDGLNTGPPDWGRNFTYRFVTTLYNRNFRVSNATGHGAWSVVRLYAGTDPQNRVQDRVVVKVFDWPHTASNDAGPLVAHLRRAYENLDQMPNDDHILRPRDFLESDYHYRPRDENGNVRLTPEGSEERIRRLGIRSFTDYCEGGTLLDVIKEYSWENRRANREWKVPERFVWHVFHCIAIALKVLFIGQAYVAGGGETIGWPGGLVEGRMVHRDIKPSNIFLIPDDDPDNYPRAVLADFDLATLTNEQEHRQLQIGTQGYISPENYVHGTLITTKADIWSLGEVIWDLMNSIRGNSDELLHGHQGISTLRAGLDQAMQIEPDTFADDRASHDYMQDFIDTRNDLPAYTTWLTKVVDQCSVHLESERLDAAELIREIDADLDNIRMLTHDTTAPQDSLRTQRDPFLPGRIWNLTRRRRN